MLSKIAGSGRRCSSCSPSCGAAAKVSTQPYSAPVITPARRAGGHTDIPATTWPLPGRRGDCPGLDWTLLAGIGKVESDHGRSTLPGVHSGPSGAGAEGVMQFEPPMFAAYDLPARLWCCATIALRSRGRERHPAARMLCGNGTGRGEVSTVIFDYNHSTAYVQQVLAQARAYAHRACTSHWKLCFGAATGCGSVRGDCLCLPTTPGALTPWAATVLATEGSTVPGSPPPPTPPPGSRFPARPTCNFESVHDAPPDSRCRRGTWCSTARPRTSTMSGSTWVAA